MIFHLKSPKTLKGDSKKGSCFSFATFLSVVFVLAFSSSGIFAQSKGDLQKKKDDLAKKIEVTKKLINESEQLQKITTNQLQVLNEQIGLREELLSTINSEITGIEGEIQRKEETLKRLEVQLNALKDEYANMIVQAYKNRSSYDKLMFVFAADDFNQAYKRMKLLQHYAETRKKQVELIASTQQQIQQSLDDLEKTKNERRQYAQAKVEEKNKIDNDKRKQQEKLNSLKSEEKKLREKVKKQERESIDLANKIKKIIEEEMKPKATPPKTTPPGGKTTPSPPKMEVAPEVKIASSDFEKNKGGLPWPVGSGIITGRFGKQPHPTVSDNFVNNNGVDFTTEKSASVNAIFDGEVTSVFYIEGFGENVIITKGAYKVVYGKLSSVAVKKGDKVSLKQKIGTVMNDGEANVAHLEIWKVTPDGGTPLNPELWLKKK
jgi:septal ring factor EnvC (AmiA/AmiB activator)